MSQQASRAGVFTVNRSRVLVGGLMAVVIAALSAGCRQATPTAAEPPPTVEVEPVAEKDVPIYGEWVGTTVGYVTAQIRARVSGYLMRQNYKEGTLVKAGDVLFEIDARTYQLAERQAGAALRLVESQLEQAKAQVAQAEADLARAEATQKRSELDVARYAPLAGSGAVTQQEVDNAVQTDSANVAIGEGRRRERGEHQGGSVEDTGGHRAAACRAG